MERIEFCSLLKEVRQSEESGYTQAEIANALGVSTTTISKLENGKYNFSMNFVFRYIKALCTYIYLISNDDCKLVICDSDIADFMITYRDCKYGLELQDIADLVGCSALTIDRIEKCEESMTIDSFLKFIDSIGYRIEVFQT